MIARAAAATVRRLAGMFAAGWRLSLGLAVALLAAWRLAPAAPSGFGFAVAAVIALLLLADIALTARRQVR